MESVDPLLELIDKLVEKHDESISRTEIEELSPDGIGTTDLLIFLDKIGLIECSDKCDTVGTVTILENDCDRIRTRAENLYLLDDVERDHVYEAIQTGQADPTDLEDGITISTLLDKVAKISKNKKNKKKDNK